MALRTHFEQPEIGCLRVAEFTVQRTKALFDHITSFRSISVTLHLSFRLRVVAVVSEVTGFLTIQVLFDRVPINHLIHLQ